MARTIATIDAELAAKTRQARHLADLPEEYAERRTEIDALLEERHRLSAPLRPSQVLARR